MRERQLGSLQTGSCHAGWRARRSSPVGCRLAEHTRSDRLVRTAQMYCLGTTAESDYGRYSTPSSCAVAHSIGTLWTERKKTFKGATVIRRGTASSRPMNIVLLHWLPVVIVKVFPCYDESLFCKVAFQFSHIHPIKAIKLLAYWGKSTSTCSTAIS